MAQSNQQVAEPSCPRCGEPIQPEGFRFWRRTARCSGCGYRVSLRPPKTANLCQAKRETNLPWSPDSPVPAPARPSTKARHAGNDLVLSRRCAGPFEALSLIPLVFLCFVALLILALFSRSIVALMLIAPVAVVGGGMLLIVMYTLVGTERLRISPRGLEYEWRAGFRLDRKSIPLERFQRIHRTVRAPDPEVKRPPNGLVIVTTDGRIEFADGIEEDETLWLNDLIRRHIAAYLPGQSDSTSASAPSSTTPGRGTTVLRFPCAPIPRPAGSTIRLRRRRNRTSVIFPPFWKCGTAIAFLVAANLVWDGFFLALASTWLRHFDLMTFLYTLPFGLVGLLLLSPFFVPYGRQEFVFTPEKVLWMRGVIPRRKRLVFSDELTGLARLEIRGVCTFSLVLISKDGEELHRIRDLNESDARWLGSELLKDFHEWGLLLEEPAHAHDAE